MFRVGMIVPSSNTTLEPLTYRMVGRSEQVSVHFARLPVTRIALDADSDNQFGAPVMTQAAQLLADAEVDVIAWNGTAGSWLGPDYDRTLCEAIREATGVPATTSTLALLHAYRIYGVTRLGLALPYTEDVARRIVETYRGEGIDCVSVRTLGLTENTDFGALPPERVRELIGSAADGGADAVAVVCTNVAGAPHVAAVEAETGIPVFDSVTATLWKTLEDSGIRLPGWGTLAEGGAARTGFDTAIATLLEATGADRTTLRIDLPDQGMQVDLTAAERLRPGVRSLRREAGLDQRKLATVEWLDTHREVLVQPHFRADPVPPAALRETYGVQAQMLGPIPRRGGLTGWISVHSLTERAWSTADQQALAEATRQVHQVLDTYADA